MIGPPPRSPLFPSTPLSRPRHDRPAGVPAEVAADEPEEHADGGGDQHGGDADDERDASAVDHACEEIAPDLVGAQHVDRKSTRLNSSHSQISYAVFCLKKKNKSLYTHTRLSDRGVYLHQATFVPNLTCMHDEVRVARLRLRLYVTFADSASVF